MLELAGIFILMGSCFALGMYFTTQISNWINKNIKNNKK